MFLKHIQILRTMLGNDLGSGTEQGGGRQKGGIFDVLLWLVLLASSTFQL